MSFHHERLIVYRKSVEFVGLASAIIRSIDPRLIHLRDQLARAATSISLNIAEGSGEYSRSEKGRFYRMARRSATECAAILDVLTATGAPGVEPLEAARALLNEIVAILTTMAKNQAAEGKLAGKGVGA